MTLPTTDGEASSGVGEAIASSGVASTSSAGGQPQKKLDPAVLDAILGKSDAQRMMEAVRDLKSDAYNHEQKMYIWDELEMLVENLDNANDLEKMKLWQPISDFLDDPNEEMRIQACWVLGTAIQNNPRSQAAFEALDPLPKLLSLLADPSSADQRSKAMYTLSALVRHNPSSMTRFAELDGWSALSASLEDPSLPLRRKAVFLANSLVINAEDDVQVDALCLVPAQKAGIIDRVLRSLDDEHAVPAGPNGELEEIDLDYRDKALQFLVTVTRRSQSSSSLKGALTQEQRGRIRDVVKQLEEQAGSEGVVPGDLAQSEWEDFKATL